MELILQRLTLVEYLKCRNVCQSWRVMVNAAISIEGRISLKPLFPFILSLPTYPFHPINLLSLTENKLYTWPIPKLDENLQRPQKFNDGYHYAYQFSSFDGWLIVQDFYEEIALGLSYCLIYFNDPMSNDMFMLPKLSLSSYHGHYQIYQLSKIAVSYKLDGKDLIVASFVLIKCEGQLNQQLFLCDVRGKSWTRIETQEFFFDITIHDSKLYAIGQDDDGDRLFEYVMNEKKRVDAPGHGESSVAQKRNNQFDTNSNLSKLELNDDYNPSDAVNS
ncbi:unnamed protein product [Lupinus luteus]|uniref:F-box domain-containing protein n=1 Tax=Lupinus luteus TaxID=3873 RepID=A0AAV1Y4B2_LUPLU